MALPIGVVEHVGGYPVHPVASMFPMIDDAELQKLADDIRENGQHEPIVLTNYYKDNAHILAAYGIEPDEFGGVMDLPPEVEAELQPDVVLIDGRNRLAACLLAGVEPIVTQDIPGNTSGKDSDSPDWEQFVTAWIVSGNLRRRHLSKGQLAAIATEIEEWKAVEAKKRQERGINQYTPERVKENFPEPSGKQASDEAGQMLGVSGRSVRDAKYVKQNDPETFEKIKSGEVAPSAAAKKIRESVKPAPTPQEVLAAREAIIQKEAEKLIRRYNPDEITLLLHYLNIGRRD